VGPPLFVIDAGVILQAVVDKCETNRKGMMGMLKITSVIVLVAMLSALAPARANDLGKVLGVVVAGAILYELLDGTRHEVPIPPNYDPPPADYHDGIPAYWYKDGYSDAFRKRPVFESPAICYGYGEEDIWYREGYSDGRKDAERQRHEVTYLSPPPVRYEFRWDLDRDRRWDHEAPRPRHGAYVPPPPPRHGGYASPPRRTEGPRLGRPGEARPPTGHPGGRPGIRPPAGRPNPPVVRPTPRLTPRLAPSHPTMRPGLPMRHR